MPNLTYTVADFQPFTKIVSADVNSRFSDIQTLLNTTKLDDDNIQDAGITRSTKLSAGTANYVVINDASGNMSEEAQLATTRGGLGFAPTVSSANAGKAVVVNDAGNSLALGTPGVDVITESLSTFVNTLTAAEGISAGDCVCVALDGDDNYRIFKTNSGTANRKNNVLGIAVASASVTPEIQTWTLSAALVTSNVISWEINGRSYSETYASSSDATLQAIATKIASDSNVTSAVVTVVGGDQTGTDDRVITITGVGGLPINITNATVSGGASQATITIAQTQAPDGDNVRVRTYGPITTSGLTTASVYYVGDSAGAITAAPSDTNPKKVGQALSSTVLFVTVGDSVTFPGFADFIKSHGTSVAATDSSGQANVELFNFTSWSSGTADSVSRSAGHKGSGYLNTNYYFIDGVDTSWSAVLTNRVFDKTSWSAGTNRTNVKISGSIAPYNGSLLCARGNTSAAASAALDSYNGSSWTSGLATFGDARINTAGAVQDNVFRTIAGANPVAATTSGHETWNGGSAGSDIAYPISEITTFACISASSNAIWGGTSNAATSSYQWSGSWSSSITMPYAPFFSSGTVTNDGPNGAGFYSNGNASYVNGGGASGAAVATTASFNGTSWSSSTDSSTSRCSGGGAVF